MFGKKLRFKCLCLAAAHANSSEDIVDVADSYYKFCATREVTEKNSPLRETTKDLSIKGKIDAAPSNTDTQDAPTPPLSSEPSPSNLTGGTVDPSQVNN